MSDGWVKLHRQMLNWEWYDDTNTKCLYLHCLLRANHSDTQWRGTEIKRGQFITSLESLSKELGLTVSQIRTSIKKLISTSELASKSQAKSRIITVVNYDQYQGNDKQASSLVASKSQANRKVVATDKNDKKKKNVNNDKNNICQQVADAYNEKLPDLGKVIKLSDTRKAKIKASIKEMVGTDYNFESLDTWNNYFDYVSQSDFLMGRKSEWCASFDFLINKSNMLKVIEGKYENQ